MKENSNEREIKQNLESGLKESKSKKILVDNGLEICRIAYEISEERKAWQPIVLDVSRQTSLCTYVFIVSQAVRSQVKSLSQFIIKELAQKGYSPLGKEGLKTSEWVLLDYGEVLINIMHQPDRDFYCLEELWSKCPEVEF